MSKEFEELVLKKLNNTEKLIQEVVLPKLDKIDILEEKVNNTDKTLKEFSGELNNLNNKVSREMDNLNNNVTIKLNNFNNKFSSELNNLNNKFSSELNNLNNKFTIFDYEINKKIDSLFDAFIVNTEKDSVHEGKIELLDEKVFNHDIRISNLENKILTA